MVGAGRWEEKGGEWECWVIFPQEAEENMVAVLSEILQVAMVAIGRTKKGAHPLLLSLFGCISMPTSTGKQ